MVVSLTSDTTVATNETLAVTSITSFPDSQAIYAHTPTAASPKSNPYYSFEFNVWLMSKMIRVKVGTAQVDPNNQIW